MQHGSYKNNAQWRDIDAVADYTVGMLLWLDRSVVERELRKNEGQWRRDVSISPPYRALSLMKVGLLGFDAVAQAVVQRLQPFGCQIMVWAPEMNPDAIAAMHCQSVDFDTIFSSCNAISVHMRIGEGEPPVVTKAAFNKMLPTAWFINVTQAEVVNEQDLIDAIVDHKIAGAGLDVFRQEPLQPDYPLIGRPDVILSPHIAGLSTCCIKTGHELELEGEGGR